MNNFEQYSLLYFIDLFKKMLFKREEIDSNNIFLLLFFFYFFVIHCFWANCVIRIFSRNNTVIIPKEITRKNDFLKKGKREKSKNEKNEKFNKRKKGENNVIYNTIYSEKRILTRRKLLD